MIFARFEVDRAMGVVLAHTLRLPHRLIKKGTVLTENDLVDIRASGVEYVTGAQLQPHDVGEDAAALVIARRLAGDCLRVGKPVAGRCNLYATKQGLVEVDKTTIDTINCLGGLVAIATLDPLATAQEGQAVATVKIIPFAIPQTMVHDCCQLLSQPALSLKPFQEKRIGLILTETANVKASVLDATTDVMQHRVRSLGSHIGFEQYCGHSIDAVEKAIKAAIESGIDLLLLGGATITVDVGDIVPSAIVRCGGKIIHFGMPVEPGNMMLLADIDGVPLINLPGCSRSPKLNGVDWLLQRILAGLEVKPADIMMLGVGGLIKDVPHIPKKQGVISNALEKNIDRDKRTPSRVAAVILAAGSSQRMGDINKLLAGVGAKAMIEHVAQLALASSASQVLVVTGYESEALKKQLEGYVVDFVHNPDYASGMASSLKTGMAALGDEIDAAVILLGDMPFVNTWQIDAMIESFRPDSQKDIVVPVKQGKRGNPVLWARRYFEEIQILEGDKGARSLLGQYPDNILELDVNDDAIFVDIDTPDLLKKLPYPSGANLDD